MRGDHTGPWGDMDEGTGVRVMGGGVVGRCRVDFGAADRSYVKCKRGPGQEWRPVGLSSCKDGGTVPHHEFAH